MNPNTLLLSASCLVTQKLNKQKKNEKILIFSSFSLTTYFLICPAFVQAQPIIPATDGTATVVNSNGNRFDISGGQLSADQANLFHSFREFGLDSNQIANFLSNPNIRNILGRVNGGNPSIINGLIQVTGGNSNLFLINPSGIIFGSSASLNVPASFTATTATGVKVGDNWFNIIGTNDYAALVGTPHTFAFTTSQPGAIINAGNLAVAQGQNLTLLGGNVINTGRLSAASGNILITAVPGENLVRLSQPGNILSLEIQPITNDSKPQEWQLPILSLPQLLTGKGGNYAAGLSVDSNRNTVLTSSGTTIPESTKATAIASGIIDVSGQTGGAVQVFGDKVALFGSNINASGTNNGGTVLLGGDYQGLGTLPTASRTFISKDTTINADALFSGNGGRVSVWANDTTGFYGNISAKGGTNFGNGGFVEVSGKQNLAFQGLVDVSAFQGTDGTILLDPENIIIQARGANDNQLNAGIPNRSDPAGTILFGDVSTADFTLSASVLERQTGSILLEASNNITIADGRSLNFVNGGSITFRADADGNGNGSFLMNPAATINTNGRDLTISGANVTLGNIDSSNQGQGNGGNVRILAQRNIITGNINTSDQGPGNAGFVEFSSAQGNIITGNIDTSDQALGNAGSVTLSAPQGLVTRGLINTTNQGPGNDGQQIIIPANSNSNNNQNNSNQNQTSNNNQNNNQNNNNQNQASNNNQNNNQNNSNQNQASNNNQNNNNQNSTINNNKNNNQSNISPNNTSNNNNQNNTRSSGNQNSAQTITNQSSIESVNNSQNTSIQNNLSPDNSLNNNNIYSNSPSVAINPQNNSNNQTNINPTNQNAAIINQGSTNQEISEERALARSEKQQASQIDNLNSNLVSSEAEFITRLDESFGQEILAYIGQSSNVPLKTLAETQNTLLEIEQISGIKPALVYVTFVPQTIASSTPRENNPLVKQENKPKDFPKLDFSKFTNSQTPRRKLSQENRLVGQNDVLELVLVTSQGIPIRQRIEGTKRSLVLKVAEQFRNELANVKHRNAYLKSAKKLYTWLIAPLETNLKNQNIKNLAFIMDGGLRTIPVAALHNGKEFLIERYNVGMMPSFSITDTRYRNIKDLQVLAMGMAKFPEHKPLPAVPVELRAITPSVWEGKSFLNDKFTLNNLKSERDRSPFGIIHLATHAEFQPGAPNKSYIQLWDTKLRLNQLRQLGWNDPPVELLVLSACQTALGNEQAELGFAGLSVQAGVKSALASLWSVSDEGTLALMSNFYEQLKQVPIKAEALRQAQLAMLKGKVRLDRDKLDTPARKLNLPPELVKQRTKTLSHPYYWAGFTMIGSPW